MADTFILEDTPRIPQFSAEMPTNSLSGHPYFTHIAPLALFNPNGSGKVVRVHEVRIDPLAAQTTTNPVDWKLQRITAHVPSGDAADVWQPVKFDSTNANLPSQVVCCRWPESVTAVDDVLDTASPVGNLQMNTTRAIAHVWGMPAFQHRIPMANSEEQRITLREGEGIHITQSDVAGAPLRKRVILKVRVVATGAIYQYFFPTNTARRKSPFSLMNGSGSGVVLEVIKIIFVCMGTDEAPVYAIEPIDGLDGDSGDVLIPTAMDSTSSLGTVYARRNGTYLTNGSKDGALIAIPHHQWLVPQLIGIGPGFANPNTAMHRFRSRCNPIYDIILREGEGIAITKKNATAIGDEDYAIIFSLSDGAGGWVVTGSFKSSSDVNLPDGTLINAYHATTHVKVGHARLHGGSATVPVSTPDNVYLVADPAGLAGETVCTTALTPVVG